ncbi:TPA: cellulose synthase operon protein YhjQ [Providencia rettgeri]|nr:cellulose synthase operon protein YhjQ [Providencia rettgeri]
MPVISIKGVRGGVGTTSLSSALAWELNQLGEKVISIDMSPDNLLHLNFNSDPSENSGWAHAIYENKSWETTAWEYKDNLLFIPFGKLNAKEKEAIIINQNIFSFWSSNLEKIKSKTDYNWIILDIPSNNYFQNPSIEQVCDININVAVPEPNCHARIFHQSEINGYILANNLDIRSELQNDIYQYWTHQLKNILPIAIHHDESIMEATASKCPVGQYRAESLGSSEIRALAIWCLANSKK